MAGEQYVLDPDEVAGDRVELDITDYVRAEGVDWGDSEIVAYMAEAERGQLPVDFRVPNRAIQIPLRILERGVVIYPEIQRLIQAKVALFQREGGFIKRQTAVGPMYADIVGATLRFGGDWLAVMKEVDLGATLTLECIPDWYGDWREVTSGLGNGDLSLTAYDVPGDYPARVRVDVGNGTAVDQRGLIWGVRSRNHDAADTAEFAYNPSDLDALDASTTFGSAVIHASLSALWTPVFSTAIATVDQMTHRGTYRVWVRASTSSAVPPELRLLWDVGDLALPVENPPQAIPTANNSHLINLGEVRLDPAPLGDHRWGGIVQARGAVGGEQVAINRIYIVPADEGYGELRAPLNSDIGLGGFTSRDEFNQTAGAVTGKTLPAGGTWGGAGDADDGLIDATAHAIVRTAVSDAGPWDGHYWIAGTTNRTTSVAQVVFQQQALTDAGSGVFLRYVDVNNWLMALVVAVNGPLLSFEVLKRKAGTVTRIGGFDAPYALSTAASYGLVLFADTAGRFRLSFGLAGSRLTPYATGADSDLATGGTLATGKQGIYDVNESAIANTRIYDFWASWAPDPDAVIFGSQDCEIRTDGIVREDLFGLGFSPVSSVVGSLPRCPPSGLEGRPVEWFLKVSRGDLGALPDSADDGFGAIVYCAPSWLQIPGA